MRQTGLFTSLLFVSFIFIFGNGDNRAGGFLPNFSFCRFLLHFHLGGGGGLYLPWCACGVQKTIYASQFSRSTMWAQMSELRSSSMVASAFILWAISSVWSTPPFCCYWDRASLCSPGYPKTVHVYSSSSCPCLPNAKIKGMCHHTWPLFLFFIWNKVWLSCLGEPWTPSVAQAVLIFLISLALWVTGVPLCATRPS